MTKSVKVNYILNLTNTVTQLLFPLITFPYAARVMQPDGIGQVNFFNSIISYIALFVALGIPLYAVREIAMVRDDCKKMNIVTAEIFILNSILMLGGYVIVAILCIFVPQIKQDVPLFLILSLTLLFSTIGCEWFYQGIEDFMYITIRGLVVKIISVVFLFVFVKTKEDILLYGLYAVLGSIGGNLFNFIHLRKYIKWGDLPFCELHPFRHLKGSIAIFAFNIVASLYLQLNTVLLGFMKDSTAVGFYTSATKMMRVVMGITTSLSSVVMPRMSNYFAEGERDQFKSLAQKSYDFTIGMTIPLALGLAFAAPYLIILFCGSMFEASILPSIIISPIIVMVGLSSVLGMQILYPMGKIGIVIKTCLIGAITDLTLCFLLIPSYSYNGCAVAYLCAEIATTASQYVLGRKYLPLKFFTRNHFHYICAGTILSAFLFFVVHLGINSRIVNLLLMLILGGGSYIIFLMLIKDSVLISLIPEKIKTKFSILR